jgi:hypothetical protein
MITIIELLLSTMDYLKKSREELITFCRGKNIKGYSGKKKSELINLLISQSDNIYKIDGNINESCSPRNSILKKLTYIDLFAGIGGFPEQFSLPKGVNKYDLFGNMACPPVITEILEALLRQFAEL